MYLVGKTTMSYFGIIKIELVKNMAQMHVQSYAKQILTTMRERKKNQEQNQEK